MAGAHGCIVGLVDVECTWPADLFNEVEQSQLTEQAVSPVSQPEAEPEPRSRPSRPESRGASNAGTRLCLDTRNASTLQCEEPASAWLAERARVRFLLPT